MSGSVGIMAGQAIDSFALGKAGFSFSRCSWFNPSVFTAILPALFEKEPKRVELKHDLSH
jgi:hypothetical protein